MQYRIILDRDISRIGVNDFKSIARAAIEKIKLVNQSIISSRLPDIKQIFVREKWNFTWTFDSRICVHILYTVYSNELWINKCIFNYLQNKN